MEHKTACPKLWMTIGAVEGMLTGLELGGRASPERCRELRAEVADLATELGRLQKAVRTEVPRSLRTCPYCGAEVCVDRAGIDVCRDCERCVEGQTETMLEYDDKLWTPVEDV
jgi:hypothetical protein